MAARRLPVNSRKLLVAAIGVAAVSYVGCSNIHDNPTSGNLMSTFPDDSGAETGQFPTSGNLMAPLDSSVFDAADGSVDDASDAGDASDANDDAHD